MARELSAYYGQPAIDLTEWQVKIFIEMRGMAEEAMRPQQASKAPSVTYRVRPRQRASALARRHASGQP
jgi:hypothetical protein